MAANIVTFDPNYISTKINEVNNIQSLLNDALGLLKKASAHGGWRCPECSTISDKIEESSKRIDKLNRGLSDTSAALGEANKRYIELESRNNEQGNDLRGVIQSAISPVIGKILSDNIMKESGPTCVFKLPKTNVPYWENIGGEVSGVIKGTEDATNTIGGADDSFGEKSNDFWSSLMAGLIETGRCVVYVGAGAVGNLLGALGGLGQEFFDIAIQGGGTPVEIGAAAVKGVFKGMDGVIEGGQKAQELALKGYEALFGKTSHEFLNSDYVATHRPGYADINDHIKNGIKKIPFVGDWIYS